MKKYILILLFVGTSYSLFSQQTPADLQSQSIVIYNAHIHIGNGDIIKNGSIGFKNGIIDYVGSKADMDNYQEIINANGKHVDKKRMKHVQSVTRRKSESREYGG